MTTTSPQWGGDITGAQLSANLGSTNVTIASSSGAGAGNGDINVKDAVSWSANRLTLTAARDVNITVVMSAAGSAALTLNTSTANGADAAVAGGKIIVDNGGRVDFDRTGNSFLTINGNAYTVLNSLGVAASSTGVDVQGMRGNLSGRYALGGNIDATATSAWNSGAGFAPIGAGGTPFAGVFDGLGHSITGLNINRSAQADVGLLGRTSAAAITRNVTLSGGTINGATNVGSLVGYNAGLVHNTHTSANVTYSIFAPGSPAGGLVGANYGTIARSSSSGTFAGNNGGHTGGLVGNNYGAGVITDSFATGDVNGAFDYHTGGLVGSNQASIINSYASGNVTGAGGAGGLVGVNWSMGSITRSYATGIVTGTGTIPLSGVITAGVGGLVGQAGQDFINGGGTISNSYATGAVRDLGDNSPTATMQYSTGGLVGRSLGLLTVTNSYANGAVSGQGRLAGLISKDIGATAANNVTNSFWDTQTTGQSTSVGGGTGKTTAQMQQQATFTGWDFTNTWRIVEGSSYPMLRAFTVGTLTLNAQARSTAKVYDGTPWVGGSVMDYSGFQNGDTTAILQGSIVWGGTAPGAVNVGSYSFIPSGLFSTKYEIVYGNGTLTVAPRPLNLTASKTYDASASFAASQFAIGNVITGDTVALTGSATVPSANAGQFTSLATNSFNTGNPNYTGSGGNIDATISPANLVITATSIPKTYDGTTSATATPKVAAGTLFNNQQLTGGSFAYLNADAGTGKAVQVSGVTVNDGNNGNNYSIRYAMDLNGEIRQRPVDIAVSKTYDNSATFTQGFASGNLVAGDTVAVNGTANVASADAGKYTGFSASSLTLNNPNYTLVGGKVDATINQATLQLVAAKAVDANKIYGEADPEFKYDVTSNPLGATLIGKLAREAGEDVKDGGYAIRQGTLTAGNNFQLQFTNGVFTIKPAGAYLWGNDYSITLGDSRPSIYAFRAVGIDGKEIPTTNFTGVTVSGPAAGQGSTIGAYALPIAGGVSKNFVISERYAGTLLVLPTNDMINLAFVSDIVALDSYRDALNKNLPSNQQAGAPGSPWVLLPPLQSVYHQNGIGAEEKKFIHPDGREVVFDGDTSKIVTDSRYKGTYNFGPVPVSFAHVSYDIGGYAISTAISTANNIVKQGTDFILPQLSKQTSDTSQPVNPPSSRSDWSTVISQPLQVTPSLERYSSIASLNPFTAYYAISMGAANESLKQLYATLSNVRASQVNDLLQAVDAMDGYDVQIEALRNATDPQAMMKLTDKLAASVGELTNDINRISQFTAGVDSVFDLANLYQTGAGVFQAAGLAKDVVGNIFSAAQKFKGGLAQFDKSLLNALNEAKTEFGSLYGADLEQSAIAIMKKNNFDDSLAKIVGQELKKISLGNAKDGYDAIQSVFDAITLVGGMAKAQNDTQAFTEFLRLSDKTDYLKMVAQDYLTMKLGPEAAKYQSFYTISKVDSWWPGGDGFKLVQTEVNVLTGMPNP